ncbi:MAG: Cna B-type domain-containing protein, partial [Enterococcus sp.]
MHDNGTNTWTGQFTDLPKYDTSGAVIHYGVVENLAGIKETYLPKDGDCELQEVAANGTAVFTNCLQATSLQVTKQWQDFDN